MTGLSGSSVIGRARGLGGVFHRTLEAVASFNPFREPAVPPGTRAARVEQHLHELEGSVTPVVAGARTAPADTILSEVRLALARTMLLPEEQSIVIWKISQTLKDPSQALPELDLILRREFDLTPSQTRTVLELVRHTVPDLRSAA